MDDKFYMVYAEGKEAPAVKHKTLEDAKKEAERIAHKEGVKTYILTADREYTPLQIKDGDVVVCVEDNEEGEEVTTQMFILKSLIYGNRGFGYTGYDFSRNKFFNSGIWDFDRLATSEEKQKLFDVIKANGYKWNDETKTLELIVPKFKVGDRIRLKSKPNYVYNIHSLTLDENNHFAYRLLPDNDKHLIVVGLHKQEDYELVPNKFDISTLKPFDRVLTRASTGDIWGNDFFGFYKDEWFHCSGYIAVHYCIPYENNEHLLGTTDDCDEYYKIWKK